MRQLEKGPPFAAQSVENKHHHALSPPILLLSQPVGTKFWAAPPKHHPTQTPGYKPRRIST
eukprot:5245709-Prorocentrum_lima.AAC.1